MAALTGTQISVTYVGLLKTSASTVLSSTAQQITDGSGNNSILYLSTAEVGIGGSPTAGKELDVTGNVLITGDLQVDNININGNTISATSGVVTLSDGTIATTQSQNDNSTKVATTAYVDTAIDGVDTLGEVLSNGDTTDGNNIVFGDSATIGTDDTLIFGAGNDLRIAHNGTDSVIRNYTGGLYIDSDGADRNIHIRNDDGSGNKTDYMVFNGAVGFTINYKLQNFQDNVSATFGNSSDLQIYHDGSNSYIAESGTGDLIIKANNLQLQNGTGTQATIKTFNGGSVELYHSGSKKFETTSSGIEITGDAIISGGDLTVGDDTGNVNINLAGGTSSNLTLNFGDSDDDNIGKIIYRNASDQMGFITNTVERLTILSDGSINISGFGTEGAYLKSNGSFRIDIDNDNDHTDRSFIVSSNNAGSDLLTIGETGNATFAGNVEVNGTLIDLDSAANATVAIDRGATSNDAIVSWRNAGSEFFRAGLDNTDSNLWSLLHTCGTGLYFDGSNMRLGFGESSPDSAFHIKQSGADFIDLERTSVGTYRLAVSGSDNFSIYDVGAASDRLVITSDGSIYNAGSANSGDYNTKYGSGALDALTSGQQNTAMGRNAGTDVTTGNYNSFFGLNAGANVTAGSFNTFLGFAAGEIQTSQSTTVGVGAYALASNVTGQHNTALGYQAMYANTGSYNTGVGYQALRNNSTGSENHASGRLALYANTTGAYNVGVGGSALESNTTGNYNTAVGNGALYDNTTGGANTALGWRALFNNVTGANNVAIGYEAGYDVSTGADNVFQGYQAGENVTTGSYNVIIGRGAGRVATSLNYATIIGRTAGTSHTSGAEPCYIGYDAGQQVTSGNYNTAIGTSAMTYGNGSDNTFVGFHAGFGQNGQSSSDNTAIGYYSMRNVSTGSYNTALGHVSLTGITTGTQNTSVGRSSLYTNTTGSNNVAVGMDALYYNTTAGNNVAVGTSALQSNATGTNSVAVGFQAGLYSTVGDNVYVGYGAGRGTTGDTGSANTFLGYAAGYTVNGGVNNVAVGTLALYDLSNGAYNNAVGRSAGANITGGSNNNLFGYNAGGSLTTAIYNTSIGHSAGQSVVTSDYNTFVGGLAGRDATGANNTFLGALAGRNATSGTANTIVGSQAVDNNTFTSSNNTVVGFTAGQDLTSGANNTYIGSEAGKEATTGEGQVAVGFEALKDCTTGSGNIAIGKKAAENLTTGGSNTVIGYAAAGGATVTGTANIIIGDAAGYNLSSGGNNILIGRNAGRTGSQTPQSMGGVTTGSNVIHIGNESHSSALVQVSWTVNSDGRDKTDVKDLDLGLDFIDSLRPVTYRWDKRSKYNGEERTGEHKESKLEVGLIAQEVIEQENKAGYNFEEDTNLFSWQSEDKNKVGLQYEKLVPALINAIKELKQEIEILKSK
jgi:hypothetical protein